MTTQPVQSYMVITFRATKGVGVFKYLYENTVIAKDSKLNYLLTL